MRHRDLAILLRRLRQADDQRGFTLVELLVVIGIIAIILAISIIALNPIKHFQDARNAQRQSDVSTILDGIYEYEAGNTGKLPPGATNVSTTAKPLGALASVTATGTSFATPNLTYTVPAGNTITTGSVTVTGCTQAGDNGTFPVVSGTTTTIVVTDAGGSATSATGCSIGSWTGRIDLCADLVPTYMANMPMDPSGSSGTACTATYNSGYTIAISSSGNRYTIAAPSAEDSATISVTR